MDNLDNFENQNVNTINTTNLPLNNHNNINRQKTFQINLDKKTLKDSSGRNSPFNSDSKETNDENWKNNSKSESNLLYNPVVHNLSICNKEKEIFSQEFEELIKKIIETNDENFLTGTVNPIEHLISKFTNIRKEDQRKIKLLKLKIDENFTLLNEFGISLHNLEELNLEDSRIFSIESIGSSFINLLNLNVSNCKLIDLSGIICFRNLKNLNCSHNLINDLFELNMCNTLITLNLEDNKIEDEENISYLSELINLQGLNLIGNKIQTNSNYLGLIRKYLPQIQKIDENF